MDVEGVGQGLGGMQFAAQVLAVDVESQLIGVGGVVSDAVVDVVVGDAGAGAEGYLPAVVGEEVETVVVMVLGDGEVAVQYEPVDEVRQLAQTAPDALRGLALGDGQPFFVALALGGAPHLFPDGEGLAGTDQQTVDVLYGQSQIGGLVLLQLHVDIAQAAADKGVVAIDDHGQRVLGALMGKTRLMKRVLQVTLEDFFLCRQPIGERTELAKQYSFHGQYLVMCCYFIPLESCSLLKSISSTQCPCLIVRVGIDVEVVAELFVDLGGGI